MPSKKRRRAEPPSIHPRNRYADSPPDFAALASLYPSFQPHVFYPRDGRPRIDWTDFNATRELTRVLLFHDHGLNWWIPDGQLCPTVPNRSNYIHWIEDLLSSDIIPKNYHAIGSDDVRGFDIGTGANCIYPLLGASLLGWSFVGSDVTDVALEWAEKNVRNNSHVSQLIEIRKVERFNQTVFNGEVDNNRSVDTVSNLIGSMCGEEEGFNSYSLDVNETYNGPPVNMDSRGIKCGEEQATNSSSLDVNRGVCKSYSGPPVLLGVIKDGERFDFCMCNPPFFESMEEAGLNPKTACGGTQEEMVCPGGEQAFITRIIEDSVVLKQSFRWYTSMVGRKTNLKALIGKLWEFGVTIVKTTEFVQGQTRRWGLAWSFVLPTKKIVSPHVVQRSVMSFMLEGLQREFSAIHVLQEVESFFLISGASCKTNATLFTVDITASEDHCDAILRNSFFMHGGAPVDSQIQGISKDSSCLRSSSDELCFRILVFQQTPGTLLVKASVRNIQMPVSGAFSLIFQRLEEDLKSKFCRENTRKVSSAV